MSKINYEPIKQLAGEQLPVYCQYPGQLMPQDAYIYMNEYGVVIAKYKANIGGGVTTDVWHQTTLCWPINPALTGNDILALVEDNLPLFERVHAGHCVEWGGQNFVGTLDDDARSASESLDAVLYLATPSVEVWEASEWLFSVDDLDTVWPEELTLDECVHQCEQVVSSDQVIDGDFKDALLQRARELYDDESPKLLPHHLAALVQCGEITQAEADAYLDEQTGAHSHRQEYIRS